MPERQLVFPTVKVHVLELERFYDARPTADRGVFVATIILPANDDTEDKIYTFEVYTNGRATGLKATVTVAGTDVVFNYYDVDSAIANPSVLTHEGGDITISIKFKIDD